MSLRRASLPMLLVALLGLLSGVVRAGDPGALAGASSCGGPASCCCDAPALPSGPVVESAGCDCVEPVPAPAPSEALSLGGPDLSAPRPELLEGDAWPVPPVTVTGRALRPTRVPVAPAVRDAFGVRLL